VSVLSYSFLFLKKIKRQPSKLVSSKSWIAKLLFLNQNSSLMEFMNIVKTLISDYPGYLMLGLFLVIIGAAGGAALFTKGGYSWLAAFVPVWNVIIILKMVGRPVSHLAYFLVPFYNVYFFFKLFIELAQSFGKNSILDYILVCVFNVFYVLNLALAYNEEYLGPVYGKDLKNVRDGKPALV
jgi:hypothetical protein